MANKDDDLKDAKEAFQTAYDAESEQRIISLDDLKFAKLGEQWDEKDVQKRKIEGRPCLTINRIPAFLRQVTNDARQNRPAIACHPVGEKADRDTAEIFNGLIRNIEYTSNADVAYDTGLDFAATMGYGYWMVRTDYACEDSFDLDLLIERVANPFSIYGDPFSTAADSSDWNDAFVTNLMRKSAFLKKWPGADQTDFQGDGFDSKEQPWFQGESILVAEYWKRREVDGVLLKLSNDALMYEPEYLKVKDYLDVEGVTIAGTRKTKTYKVVQQIMNGSEILEENDWRGKYIPIIPVYGDEVNVEGKRYFKSLFRDAKDAQRMLNYWRTASTELVALAPKAPWIGPVGSFVTDARKWESANTVSHQFIEYDAVVDAPGQIPQRQPFAGPPAGALQEAMNASDDLKSIMGIFDASLGAKSNETSGRAILARQREGDVSTFHIIDNCSRAIRHTGRILVDLIPKHYDVPRVIRCIKEDGSNYSMPINQPVVPQQHVQAIQNGQQPQQLPPGATPQYVPAQQFQNQLPPDKLEAITKVFDLTVGKYDVTVEAGPSFTTRREEAATQMLEFVRSFPQVAPLIGDLIAKNLDWPGADEIAKRLQVMLPPQAQSQVDPMVQHLQQMLQTQDGQAKQAVATLQQHIADMQKQLADKQREQEQKEYDARTKRMSEVATAAAAGYVVQLNPQTGEYLPVPIQAPKDPTIPSPDEAAKAAVADREMNLRQQELDIKARDIGIKERETHSKLNQEALNQHAQQFAQVDIPAAHLNHLHAVTNVMGHLVSHVAKAVQPATRIERAVARKNPETGVYEMEKVIAPAQEQDASPPPELMSALANLAQSSQQLQQAPQPEPAAQ